ncbi:hypothetical protein IGL76_002696 [Enterococcus sp. DIV2381]
MKPMKRYKNILLWSTLLLSFFRLETSVYAEENQNPIYNPADPSQQIEPLDNTNQVVEAILEESEEPQENEEEEHTTETTEEETEKTKRNKRLDLSEDLFNDYSVEAIMKDDPSGAGGKPRTNFYLDLVNELVGTVIYGRKS